MPDRPSVTLQDKLKAAASRKAGANKNLPLNARSFDEQTARNIASNPELQKQLGVVAGGIFLPSGDSGQFFYVAPEHVQESGGNIGADGYQAIPIQTAEQYASDVGHMESRAAAAGFTEDMMSGGPIGPIEAAPTLAKGAARGLFGRLKDVASAGKAAWSAGKGAAPVVAEAAEVAAPAAKSLFRKTAEIGLPIAGGVMAAKAQQHHYDLQDKQQAADIQQKAQAKTDQGAAALQQMVAQQKAVSDREAQNKLMNEYLLKSAMFKDEQRAAVASEIRKAAYVPLGADPLEGIRIVMPPPTQYPGDPGQPGGPQGR